MTSEPDRLAVLHSRGPYPCHRIAFYTRQRWGLGEPMLARDAILLDGTTPASGATITCGSCGKEVEAADLAYADGGTPG